MKEIESELNELCKQYQISLFSPINLEKVRTILKLNIIYYPYGRDSFSGMALKKDGYSFILINSRKTRGHQNFTIAHEIYHLFIQKNFKKVICHTMKFEKAKDKNERKADIFAINFLMSKKAIREYLKINNISTEINKIKFIEIIKLENYFGVSHHATLIRLKSLSIINQNYFDELNNAPFIKRVRQLGIDVSLYEPTFDKSIYSDYSELITRVYNDNKISHGRYRELLSNIGCSEEELLEKKVIEDSES